ncbi:Protein of unknown function DUF4249 [Gemmatirosa kalamazoonensis]|uniref:Lipoprotein n=1 Tax=Gemmatirosa kalamazoonensis TaxID=861299 RepID=W0RHW5_9BACT|nr:DUF4249 family protein [Gemmatirosa kalamazoonensis]AHG90366.1 Protein of unknown function DUF4249 [Gemmatirosa kalamazoonensis]
MRRVLASGVLALLAACEFGERSVAPGEERPVVHAVLNPTRIAQSVLVERTLTGRVSVFTDSAASAVDPIVSGGGVPISGARVTVVGPDGTTATAIETRVSRNGAAPAGTGVYRFVNTAPDAGRGEERPPGFGLANEIVLVPGRRYRLRVETPDGRVTTGETLVPGSTLPPDDFRALEFNRDTDTLRLRWDALPGARTYTLRIDTPYGAFFMFSDSTSVSLTGELRNLFADRLPRVFQAGFTQNVWVAAVDTNYFDYYRSANNPFTGSGIINRLDGGIGFFGSYVPVMARALFVRASNHDPVDGRYVSASPAGEEILRVWLDARGNGVAEATAAYRLPGGDQYGCLGTLQGDELHLRTLDPQDYRRVLRTIDGVVRNDTIFARVAGLVSTNDPGTRVFVKRAAPDTSSTLR